MASKNEVAVFCLHNAPPVKDYRLTAVSPAISRHPVCILPLQWKRKFPGYRRSNLPIVAGRKLFRVPANAISRDWEPPLTTRHGSAFLLKSLSKPFLQSSALAAFTHNFITRLHIIIVSAAY